MQAAKRNLECPYNPPLKKALYAPIRTPLPFSFPHALLELKRLFELERSDRVVKKIISYLRKNFHQKFDHAVNEAIKALYASTVQRKDVRKHLEIFCRKDDHFPFSQIPIDTRNLIFSYLDKEDYRAAKEFVRGDINRFMIDWINAKKCAFFGVVPYKPKTLREFITRYGNEIKHLHASRRFREFDLEWEHLSNLSFIKIENVFLADFPQLINNLPVGIKKISFRSTGFADQIEVLNLTRLENLSAISAKNTMYSFHENAIAILKTMKNLTALSLSYISRPKEFYNHIGGMDNLLKLKLECNDLSFEDMPKFTSLTNLLTLRIGSNYVGNTGARIVGTLTSLTKLSIANGTITSNGLAYLSGLTRLIFLDINRNSIGDEETEVLQRFSRLQTLDMGSCDMTDVGVRTISLLTNLTELDLGRNPIIHESRFLRHLTKLVRLNLMGHGQVNLSHLIEMPSLTCLNLEMTHPCQPQLIPWLSRLKVLNATNNQFGDGIMRYIAMLPSLTTLECGENNFGLSGAKELMKLTNLTCLGAQHTLIGSKGAKLLAALPKLTAFEFFPKSRVNLRVVGEIARILMKRKKALL